MAFDSSFINLLGMLSQMQTRRSELQIQQQQADLEQSKFGEFIKSAHDKDIADALQTLLKLQPQQQEAYLKLNQRFTPEEMSSLKAVAGGLPPDVAAMAARMTGQGVQSMSPQDQTQLSQAVAARGLTGGMTPGQVGQSGFEQLAASAAAQNPQMVGGRAQMMATNQTPLGAAADQSVLPMADRIGQYQYGLQMNPYQQAMMGVQRGGVQAQFYGHNVQAMIGAQQMALERLRLTMKEDPAKQMLQLMEFRQKALDAIEAPRASPGGNKQRIADANTAAMMMGRPDLVVTDENDPDAPRKMSMLSQWIHATPGFTNQVPNPGGTIPQPAPYGGGGGYPQAAPIPPMPGAPPIGVPQTPAINPFLQGTNPFMNFSPSFVR